MHYLRPLIVLAVAASAAAESVPPATEIVQEVSLQEAARAGIVQLSARPASR